MASNKSDKEERAKTEDIEEVEYPEGYEYVRDIVKPYRDDIWKISQAIKLSNSVF